MKNKAKITRQMERERGPKSKQVQKQKQKAVRSLQNCNINFKQAYLQNTCPNGFIPKLGESPKSLFSGKTSCSLRFLAVGKLDPEKDK